MKLLKTLFTGIMFLGASFTFAQESLSNDTNVEIHEVGITVDSLEELKTIDWDDFFGFFDVDDSKTKITFYVELKDVDMKVSEDRSLVTSKLRYSVSGYEDERDELRNRMVSITNKILKKYKS